MARNMKGGWKNKGPADAVRRLTRSYGPPDNKNNKEAVWNGVGGVDKIIIKDESIKHSFPKPHRDYLYSIKKIKVNPNHQDDYARVTGSIIIDKLKGTVEARCQDEDKNASTLLFVEDGEAGRVQITKAEYSRYILTDKFPRWYKRGRANLSGSNLRMANLRGTNLCGARTGIKDIDTLFDKNFCAGENPHKSRNLKGLVFPRLGATPLLPPLFKGGLFPGLSRKTEPRLTVKHKKQNGKKIIVKTSLFDRVVMGRR